MLSNGYLKRYVRCCLLIIGLCPALLYAQSSPNAEDKLVRIASGEWPPFIGSDLPNYGFVGEIITQAFTKQGYQVEFQFYHGQELMLKPNVVCTMPLRSGCTARIVKSIFL